ncbi:MAG TPA: hypothetical protein VKZ60_17270 [Chloroflexota bacterium]|nr:hypothetical protein [Chloroflexota bacterium]
MGRALRWAWLMGWATVALVSAAGGLWPLTARAQAPAADNPPPLQIARRVITVLGADTERQALEILERVDLRNPADTPFVPDPAGAGGPMGVLRFALPRGAYDLALDDRLSSAETIPVDRGFGSLLTLPPGTTDVTFAYRVPYTGRTFALDTGVVYPTDSVLVLVPRPLEASGPQLTPRETVPIGRQEYQVLAGAGLAAGQRLVVTVDNLPYTPRPWLLEAPVQRALAAAGAAASVAAVAAYAWWRGRTARLDAACWQ